MPCIPLSLVCSGNPEPNDSNSARRLIPTLYSICAFGDRRLTQTRYNSYDSGFLFVVERSVAIWPLFPMLDQTCTHWVLANIVPLFLVERPLTQMPYKIRDRRLTQTPLHRFHFSASSSACFSSVEVLAGLKPTKRLTIRASGEIMKICGIAVRPCIRGAATRPGSQPIR